MSAGNTEKLLDVHPPPSLDLLYDFIKSQVDAQNAQINAYDSKASFVLGSASLLTAGAAGLQTTVLGGSTKLLVGDSPSVAAWVLLILTCLALGAYLFVVWAAWKAYRVRDFEVFAQLKKLRNAYLNMPTQETKLFLADNLAHAFERNHIQMKDKAEWVDHAVKRLRIQAVFIAGLILAQLLIRLLP
jgi:hypothetical protein